MKMTKFKRIFAVLLAMAVLSASALGCGGSSSGGASLQGVTHASDNSGNGGGKDDPAPPQPSTQPAVDPAPTDVNIDNGGNSGNGGNDGPVVTCDPADGIYLTVLSPYDATIGYGINDMEITGNSFYFDGGFGYSSNPDSNYEGLSFGMMQVVFTVDENTSYIGTGGEGDPFTYTYSEFKSICESQNGLGLFVYVNNGVVAEMAVMS